MQKTASAKWSGGIKDGKGYISTQTGVLKDAPYGFAARFEEGPGTNPEELIGAAHAGCFTMAFSLQLTQAGLTAEQHRNEVYRHAREGRGRLLHHGMPSGHEGKNPRYRSSNVREASQHGERRLPGLEAVCQNAKITLNTQFLA